MTRAARAAPGIADSDRNGATPYSIGRPDLELRDADRARSRDASTIVRALLQQRRGEKFRRQPSSRARLARSSPARRSEPIAVIRGLVRKNRARDRKLRPMQPCGRLQTCGRPRSASTCTGAGQLNAALMHACDIRVCHGLFERVPSEVEALQPNNTACNGSEDDLTKEAQHMALAEAMLIVLVIGDFASTFFYHVPQHLWFTLHLRTHHDRKRSYWDHAVLSTNREVLLDGFLGAVPYLIVAALVWQLSWPGAVAWVWCSGSYMSGGAIRRSWGGRLPPGCWRSPAPPSNRPPRGPRRPSPKPRYRVWRYLSLL